MKRIAAMCLTIAVTVTGVTALTAAVDADAPVAAASTYRAGLRRAIDQLPVRSETPAGYRASRFPHWRDADGDGQNTRNEVLIAESRRPVTYVDDRGDAVERGWWRSWYDGEIRTRARNLAVDHVVPLKEAWDSGAKRWTRATRRRFANDLGDGRSLRAVTARADRSKGERDPAQWLPARNRCRYVKHYVAVKTRWRLSVDPAEKRALHRVRRNTDCRGVIEVTHAKIARRWTHFPTRRPGASLPSGAQCARRVRPATEIRPANRIYNRTPGTNAHDSRPRVRGDFTGTTDEILQWAACKWGIDEDLVRAQAVIESWWFQRSGGDTTNDPSRCHPDLRDRMPCPESIGLLKVRYPYHAEAFEDGNAIRSSAYNVDYTYSIWRECFNGRMTWLNTVERGRQYTAGDARGCLGVWFSGRWYTQPAREYIDRVLGYRRERTWEQPYFINAT